MTPWDKRRVKHLFGGGVTTENSSASLGPYRQNADGASRPSAQQLVQLLPGDGVGHQAEDKEGGEDDAQSAAQKRVQPDASVVRHIGSACKQTESWVNIGFPAPSDVPTRCFFTAPGRLRRFRALLKPASEQPNLTCPFLICHWWWNKWDPSPSPADPKSSGRPGWWFSQWSDTHRQSGSHSGSAKK